MSFICLLQERVEAMEEMIEKQLKTLTSLSKQEALQHQRMTSLKVMQQREIDLRIKQQQDNRNNQQQAQNQVLLSHY